MNDQCSGCHRENNIEGESTDYDDDGGNMDAISCKNSYYYDNFAEMKSVYNKETNIQ